MIDNRFFKQSIRRRYFLPIVGFLAILFSAQAGANVMINTDSSEIDNILGVSTFAATGASMAGMSVSAIFEGSSTAEEIFWVATGAESGGVTGTDWELSVNGDTGVTGVFWTFTNNTGTNLQRLIFDGRGGLTLFDLSFGGNNGTTDSFSGQDFMFSPLTSFDAVANYSRAVGVNGLMPVEDLFNVLGVDFITTGMNPVGSNSFEFIQDTDNDIAIPEPSSIAMISLAFGLFGFSHRSRKKNIIL